MEIRFEIHETHARVTLAGDLEVADVDAVGAWLRGPHARELTCVTLEMEDCDTEDGAGILGAIDLVRRLSRAGVDVYIVHAPQIFAHDLYRTRLLEAPSRLHLVEPRQELGRA